MRGEIDSMRGEIKMNLGNGRWGEIEMNIGKIGNSEGWRGYWTYTSLVMNYV